jgi:hypothetical protein
MAPHLWVCMHGLVRTPCAGICRGRQLTPSAMLCQWLGGCLHPLNYVLHVLTTPHDYNNTSHCHSRFLIHFQFTNYTTKGQYYRFTMCFDTMVITRNLRFGTSDRCGSTGSGCSASQPDPRVDPFAPYLWQSTSFYWLSLVHHMVAPAWSSPWISIFPCLIYILEDIYQIAKASIEWFSN